ncbi:hypothetical protein RCBAKA_31 [Rhodobacter phage RcBaka]|nr:hypothetical protein RCBAKA_31 [Rhodobacter phage RcBaka]UUV44882.1 hypothetical protein RCSWAN_29 [Rhodobacter phage RcSwan]
MKELINLVALPLVRHALTAGGGALVAGGYLDASQVQAASGAVLTLVGIGLSLWDKRSRR